MHSHCRLLDALKLTSLTEKLGYSLYWQLLLLPVFRAVIAQTKKAASLSELPPLRTDNSISILHCEWRKLVRAQLIYQRPAYLIASFPGESGYRLTKNILKLYCFRPTSVSSCRVCDFDVASGSGWQPAPTTFKPREPQGGVHIHHLTVAGRLLPCCPTPCLDCQIYASNPWHGR